MVKIFPVGLATAPVANQLSVLAVFKEKLCLPCCASVPFQTSVEYSTGTPVLNNSTVFIPVIAKISIISGVGPNAKVQSFIERFWAAFQGQSAVPTSVTVASVGRIQNDGCGKCGNTRIYTIDDSLVVTIEPPAAATTATT